MSSIRQLQPGEAPPNGTPRRYRNASGYVRLRWPLEDGGFVEVYEHRWVVGRRPNEHGSLCIVWRITEAGRARAEELRA